MGHRHRSRHSCTAGSRGSQLFDHRVQVIDLSMDNLDVNNVNSSPPALAVISHEHSHCQGLQDNQPCASAGSQYLPFHLNLFQVKRHMILFGWLKVTERITQEVTETVTKT